MIFGQEADSTVYPFPPHTYPKGYGTFTVSIYADSYLADTLWLLNWMNEEITKRGGNVQFIALEKEPDRDQVRFSLEINGEDK